MAELDLTDIQSKVSEMILATPAPGKHCARSAISHLTRCWTLRKLDPGMAVFRAITGEEESVSAIFHSLKRLKYVGAEKLKPRNHVHKAALQPFLAAVENNFYLSKIQNLSPGLEVDVNEKNPQLKTRLTIIDESGQGGYVYPVPPLNFSVKQNRRLYDFSGEILQVTNQSTIDKVVDHIRSIANRRNQVLYASQQGVPEVQGLSDKVLLDRRDRIFRNLIIYLLIDPHPIQLFVQQALTALLEMLGLLPRELDSDTT